MPQDTGPHSKPDAELSAAAARILEDVKSEPVPDAILDLAHRLDQTLRAVHGRTVPKDPTRFE